MRYKILILFMLAGGTLITPGCSTDSDDGPLEKAGRSVDQAVDESADAVGDTAQEAGDQIKDATDQ